MKAGLYLRVSTEFQTTDNQRLALEEYCQRQGWTIAKVYDETMSGARDDRPELNRLLDDAAKKKIDVAVAWSIDRMGRSTKHLLNVLTLLETSGCGMVFTSQQIDSTTPAGKMMLTMLAAISEFERSLIVDRVKLGIQRKRAESPTGAWGRPRRGIDIKTAFELRAQGLGYKQISTRMGIPRSTLYRTLSAIPKTPASKAA